MSAENENSNRAVGLVGVIGQIVDSATFYQDALQPAAREAGKAARTVVRAVNACLLPLEGLVWGFEQVRDFVQEKVASKLDHLSASDIQPPKANVAVPTLDALRYTGPDTELAELFANLLAASMIKGSAHHVHPGFVEVIKNLCSDEARLLRQLHQSPYRLLDVWLVHPSGTRKPIAKQASLIAHHANCEHPQLLPTYIENLLRLSLVEIGHDESDFHAAISFLERYSKVDANLRRLLEDENGEHDILTSLLLLRDFGKQFVNACVVDHRETAQRP